MTPPPQPPSEGSVRWSGSATRSEGGFARGAILSSAGMLLSMAGQMGAAMIFTRVVPEADVGILALLLLVGDLGVILTNFGLWPALPKLVASAAEGERLRLVRAVLGFQLPAALGAGVLIWSGWLLLRDPSRVSANPSWLGLYPFLWVLPIYMLAGNVRENGAAILAGLNRYGRRAGGLVAGAMVNVAFVALIVWAFRAGLKGLVVVTLLAQCATAFCLYALLPVGRRLSLERTPYREALRFSWPLYANTILTFVFLRVDTLVVAWLLGPASAAYFEYGVKRLAGYGSLALQSALVPYLPSISARVTQNDREGTALLLDRTSSTVTFVCYAGILATVALQEPLVTLFFGAPYLSGLPAFAPILVATCIALQAGIMGMSLVALGKPHLVTATNIVTALLSAGLALVLVRRFGLAGAGWAAVLAMGFSNAAQTWHVRRSGIHVNLRRHVQPHVFVFLALGLAELAALGGYTMLGRLAAWILFVLVGLAAGAVAPDQIRDAARALLPRSLGKRA